MKKSIFLKFMLLLMAAIVPQLSMADYRTRYKLDNGTGINAKIYAWTGNAHQSKFRLTDNDVQNNWLDWQTTEGHAVATREKPYVEFDIRTIVWGDGYVSSKQQHGIAATENYATVYIRVSGKDYYIGRLHDRQSVDAFQVTGSTEWGVMHVIQDMSNKYYKKFRVHFYPSKKLIESGKKFGFMFKRHIGFLDDGVFSDDWDHMDYEISQTDCYSTNFKKLNGYTVKHTAPNKFFWSKDTLSVEDFVDRKNWSDESKNFSCQRTYSVDLMRPGLNGNDERITYWNISNSGKPHTTTTGYGRDASRGFKVVSTITDRSQVTVRGNRGTNVNETVEQTAGWDMTYVQTTYMPGVPYVNPKDFEVIFDQIKRQMVLKWKAQYWKTKTFWTATDYNYSLYRLKVKEDGTPYNDNEKWHRVCNTVKGPEEEAIDSEDYKFEKQCVDNSGLEYNQRYKYVLIVSKDAWKLGESQEISVDDMNMEGIGYICKEITTVPHVDYNLRVNTDSQERLAIEWQYSAVPDVAQGSTVDFIVERSDAGADNWKAMDKPVKAPQTPKADKWLLYVDGDAKDACTFYDYRVSVTTNSKLVFTSPVLEKVHIPGGSIVTSVQTSKGDYAGRVRIKWTAKQVGTNSTTYEIQRKSVFADEDSFREIATVTGTASSYTYDDQTVETGQYYDYRVIAYGHPCEEGASVPVNNHIDAPGFGVAKGVISGKVTYGQSSTSVEGVRIDIEPTSDDQDISIQRNAMYSASSDDLQGLVWDGTQNESGKIFNKSRDFSVQTWVKVYRKDANVQHAFMHIPGMNDLTLQHVDEDHCAIAVDGNIVSDALIQYGRYTNLTLIVKDSVLTVVADGDYAGAPKATISRSDVTDANAAFVIGGTSKESMESVNHAGFHGLLADVRIWTEALDSAKVKTTHDRILSGRESNLALYWSFDEGLKSNVFDYSYTNGVPNGHHGIVGGSYNISSDIPSKSQLALYAITDADGSYTLRGVPFVGAGSGYKIYPSLGVHDFAPATQNGYISNSSLTLNGINFNDMSSFEVYGNVYYQDTDIPVDSVSFSIDGAAMLMENSKPIISKADGSYLIHVPIGSHYIQAVRNGHVLSRWPEQGTFEFLKGQQVNFTDSTLVNVAGRLFGGQDGKDVPLGFGNHENSHNAIGSAKITLQLDGDHSANNRFNVKLDATGGFVDGTEEIPVYPDNQGEFTIVTKSARRPAGEGNTKYVEIETNPSTGEFSALLPPLKYKIAKIEFAEVDRINHPNPYNAAGSVFQQNLPVIDASQVHEPLNADSLRIRDKNGADSIVYVYTSRARFERLYRARPDIEVLQGPTDGEALAHPEALAYGMDSIVIMKDNVEKKIPLIDWKQDGKNWTFKYLFGNTQENPDGYPIFHEGSNTELNVHVSETYYNFDENEYTETGPMNPFVTTQNVKDGAVHFTNEMCSATYIAGPNVIIDDKKVKMGEVINPSRCSVTPSEQGYVTYGFQVSKPNPLGKDYLRNLSITYYSEDGTAYDWVNPQDKSNSLHAVVLGEIMSGTDFVTQGPSKIDLVIRDPGGSASSASRSTNTISTKYQTTNAYITTKNSGSTKVIAGKEQNMILMNGVLTGVAIEMMGLSMNVGFKSTLNIGMQNVTTQRWDIADYWTYTTSQKLATSTGNRFVGRDGDIFYGRSYNVLFGDATYVDIREQPDGSYKLESKSEPSTGMTFATNFAFTEAEIRNTMIPAWKNLRNSMFVNVDGYGTYNEQNNTFSGCPVQKGKVVAYTMWKPGDEEYGHSNSDHEYWDKHSGYKSGKLDKRFPGYFLAYDPQEWPLLRTDSIESINNQIKQWEIHLAHNEHDKMLCKKDPTKYNQKNYSVSGGATINESRTAKHTVKDNWTNDFCFTIIHDKKFETSLTGTGSEIVWKGENGAGGKTDHVDQTDETTTFDFTLSETDPESQISIDVFDSPTEGWGPVFITRGGRTKCPYEGGSVVLYDKENLDQTIDEPTKAIEKADLNFLAGKSVTNIPAGGKAYVEVGFQNLSEIGQPENYVLLFDPEYNQNGAVVTIDGAVVSGSKTNGYQLFLPAGETKKTLVIEQKDPLRTDYSTGTNALRMRLQSACDTKTYGPWHTLELTFVPSSPKVNVVTNHTTLNGEMANRNKEKFNFSITDLDPNSHGLKGVRLLTRRVGRDDWTLRKGWATELGKKDSNMKDFEEFPNDAKFNFSFIFDQDGEYEVKAQTETSHGSGEGIVQDSEIIRVVQDLVGPRLLGNVTPSISELDYNNRENIIVKFNEDINTAALSAGNLKITGYQNNVVEEGSVPNVGLRLSGEPCSTEATMILQNTDMTIEFWCYKQKNKNGTIINVGTGKNNIAVGTNAEGNVIARVGDANNVYVSDKKLPEDSWVYMVMNYCAENSNLIVAYAGTNDKEPVYAFEPGGINVGKFNSRGDITLGDNNFHGNVSGLCIWSKDRSIQQCLAEKRVRKAAYTPGLIGYWPLDEGHGTTAADKARGRTLICKESSWYINNQNFAAHLDGKQPLRANIVDLTTGDVDSYLMEMWFRADKDVPANKDAILMSTTNNMSLGFDKGVLNLKTYSNMNDNNAIVYDSIAVSTRDYIDNQWHHLALNVRRGQSGIVYMDGNALKTVNVDLVPNLSATELVIGGMEASLSEPGETGTLSDGSTSTKTYKRMLTGDVDELRIWNATVTADVIRERAYNKVDSSYNSLVLYYPMERTVVTGSKAEVEFSILNQARRLPNDKGILDGEGIQATTAPAIQGIKRLVDLAPQDYEIVASERELNIRLADRALARMTGNDYVFVVSGVQDIHGNACQDITWKYKTNFSKVNWADFSIDVEKMFMENSTRELKLVSSVGEGQAFEITGIPDWLECVTEGVTEGKSTVLNATFTDRIPIGNITEFLYVTDDQGISSMLRLNVTVTGNIPNWVVDSNANPNNMTLIGQFYIGDAILENSHCRIGVFDPKGNCRGIGSPRYVKSRDAFYVEMNIFGNAEDELGDNNQFTFMLYNAADGLIYSNVHVMTPGSDKSSQVIKYASNRILGSYDNPVKIVMSNDVTQRTYLSPGWNWTSLYVKPYNDGVLSEIFAGKSDVVSEIKGKGEFALANSDHTGYEGTLEKLTIGKMYKILYNGGGAGEILSVMGLKATSIDVATMEKGWNWIGSYSPYILSVTEAFADLQPVEGDFVKSKTKFASYNGKGEWEGTLDAITPGEGYLYKSLAGPKEFNYPLQSGMDGMRAKAVSGLTGPLDDMEESTEGSSIFVDPDFNDTDYPDNMNVIAVVTDGETAIDDAEIAAFIQNGLRGNQMAKNGKYYLTIHGSSDDTGVGVTIKVHANGEIYEFPSIFTFACEKTVGTPANPLVLDISKAMSIREIGMEDVPDAVYTVSGVRTQIVHNGVNIVRKNGKYQKILRK